MRSSQRNELASGVSLLGMLASVIFHSLLLTPVLFGFGSASKKARDQYIGLGTSSRDDPAMTMIWIEDSDQTQSLQRSAHRVAVLPPVENTLLASVAPPQVLPPVVADLSNGDSNDDAMASGTSVGADAGYVLMLGRYVNQVNARIERAWVRPRDPIESDIFRCRARITQESNGDVKEIELDNCNGGPAWQVSLVHAIQSASPLPAPPDPKVFSRRLVLDFHSRTFSPENATQGFEPKPQIAMK